MERADEQALIGRAQRGDGRAYEALIRAHQQSLYAFLLRMSRSHELAEDIVQEAFVRVLRNLDRFDDRYRFSTWLFTIARRLYVNHQQKHRPTFDSELIQFRSNGSASPGGVAAEVETMRNVRSIIDEALGALTTRQREIVLLFHQQNWPINEIARQLGVPEGTVKSHLHRARRRMKELIMCDEVMSRRIEEVWA